MIIVFDHSLINAKTVHTVYVKHKKEKKMEHPRRTWYKPSTWSLPAKITEITTYIVTVDYERDDGTHWIFTSEHADHLVAQNRVQEILKQVKEQADVANREMVDRLFENAVKEAP